MIQLQRNEINNRDNQKLTISLFSGTTPVIPSELNFAVYEINSPEKVLNPLKRFPTNADMYPVDIFTLTTSSPTGGKISDGKYLAIFQVPDDVSLGRCKIVWYYKLTSSAPVYNNYTEEFESIDYIAVYGSAGPPAIPISEIRAFLRDRPENHVLIDGFLFTDSDIKIAVDQTISLFNRLLPPIGEYHAGNFPDKYILTIGVAEWLFASEANRQMMEQLTYQDGNIHHGLDDKTQLYRAASDTLKQEFISLARDMKMQLNINGIYSGDGLGVRFRYNRYIGGRITL
jgi:hypothetical protein